MDKPDVDSIDGLSPAISIDQKTTTRNPRSTVGTVTEIYDYLRLLYARIGIPHCPKCGKVVTGQSAEQIVDQVLGLPEGTRFTVDAPIVRGRKGEFKDVLEDLRSDGFTRVKIDGEQYLLDEPPTLDKQIRHTIVVVVDRLVMKQGLRTRLNDSVETALRLAEGLVEVSEVDGATRTYSERFACPDDGISLPELAPRIFSFNSPHGACPRCTGLGTQREIDPELIVPDPSLSIAEGALVPWTVINSAFYEQVIQAIADRYEISLETPWQDLPDSQQNLFLYGTDGEKVYVTYRNRMGRKRSYMLAFEGIVPGLERRYRETDSNFQKERIEEYMTLKPCPLCHGARLKETSLAVTVNDRNISQFTELSVERAIDFVDGLELTDTERAIGARILKEIRERLSFLENVGVGYLTLNRAAGSLSGGEAQRIRLATQIGSSLMGVLYILDEPSIGLHQRDNARLLATLVRLRDLGNTVIVVEHDEETMRAADHIVDMGPGAGEHGGHVVATGTAAQVMASKQSLTGAYLSGRRAIPVPDRRIHDAGWFGVDGAAEHNLKSIDVELPVGKLICVTGVSGSGKSTLVNEVIYKALANRVSRTRVKPGAAPVGAWLRGVRQGDRHRPVADRPHAAVEPGHLHRPVRPHPRSVRADARVAGPRLQGRTLLVQRQGRALRDLPRRRHHQDRDALPARRVHQLRGLSRPPLQPRDARGEVQGQVDRGRAGHVGGGGGGVLRQGAEAAPAAADAARRRARLHAPRAAGHDPVGRRGTAREAGDRALEGGDGPHALHPRRAHHGAAHVRHREAAAGAAAAGRRREHRARDRAQPRRDQAGRLGARSGAGGRRQGRRDHRPGHARGGGRDARQRHRRVPAARTPRLRGGTRACLSCPSSRCGFGR
jgi:energy-coupling factor transporter ATP-binding protein EcfA2